MLTGALSAHAARVKRWRAANPEKHAAQSKRHYAAHREEIVAKNKRWHAGNPTKVAATQKRYRLANPALIAAHCAKRRAAQLQATPSWAEPELIELIYAEAAHRGMEVDHIIPLRGKTVSGLHVHNNMQLLTARQNASKGNRVASCINPDVYGQYVTRHTGDRDA